MEAITNCVKSSDLSHNSLIIDFLDFVLQHNYFVFDGVFYCRVTGTAMRAKCAPSYANLFFWVVGGAVYLPQTKILNGI